MQQIKMHMTCIDTHMCIYILESSGRPSGGLDSSGWHSDQGSQNQGIAWEIRLWKNDMEHYSTSFCREFRCASSWHSHLIRSAIFWFFYQGTLKSLRNHKIHKIHVPKIQERAFLKKKKPNRPPARPTDRPSGRIPAGFRPDSGFWPVSGRFPAGFRPEDIKMYLRHI